MEDVIIWGVIVLFLFAMNIMNAWRITTLKDKIEKLIDYDIHNMRTAIRGCNLRIDAQDQKIVAIIEKQNEQKQMESTRRTIDDEWS